MFYRAFAASLCCAVLCSQGAVTAASAITVPLEENNIAIGAQTEALRLAEEARAAAELQVAKNGLVWAEANLADAKINEVKAQAELDAAKAKYEEVALTVKKHQAEAEIKKAELARAEGLWAGAVLEVEKSKARAENASAAARKAEATARNIEANETAAVEVETIDEARIDELVAKAENAQKNIEAAFSRADEKAQQAEQLADIADAKAEAVAQLIDLKAEAADVSLAAQEALADVLAEQDDVAANVTDMRSAVLDMNIAAADAQTEVRLAQQYVAELMKPAPIISGPVYFDTGSKYYRWKNNKGQSGYQFVQPYSFYYPNKKMEYGLSTAYVISKNNSPAGRLSCFTDTELSATHTDKRGTDIFRYSLNMSLPTGKTGLAGDHVNAVMDEDLVGKNVFGEGVNAELGYSVSHKIGKEDTWTFGLRYGLRGSYDLYDENARTGNYWNKNVSWQHAGKQWRLTGMLNYQTYGDSIWGSRNYRQGGELDANFVYDEDLAVNKNLMLYYRYRNQQPLQVISGDIDPGGTLIGHYAGFSLKKSYDEKNAIRFTGDYMEKTGSSFDTHTGKSINGRTKYTFGVGYDFALNNNRKVIMDLQRFFMHNQALSSADEAKYQGYSVLLKYSGSL
ncbi:MAG: hypothetical protein H7X79_06105 [Sporomusaceae bacterium]|nr:hypothetical protein [Sporomusaceae bacterium]